MSPLTSELDETDANEYFTVALRSRASSNSRMACADLHGVRLGAVLQLESGDVSASAVDNQLGCNCTLHQRVEINDRLIFKHSLDSAAFVR